MDNNSAVASNAPASDIDLARSIAAGDITAFESLLRQCNRKLFRVSRSILNDDAEAEEALQEAYVIAYTRMASFRGDSRLTTWLTRIVINESLGRLRRQQRERTVIPLVANRDEAPALESVADRRDTAQSPEDSTLRSEMRALLERKIDELPAAFRTVFMMREVEDMSIDEIAVCLGIPAATVRTRLFRARALLRQSISSEVDMATSDAYAFAGERCDRIVAKVLNRIGGSR